MILCYRLRRYCRTHSNIARPYASMFYEEYSWRARTRRSDALGSSPHAAYPSLPTTSHHLAYLTLFASASLNRRLFLMLSGFRDDHRHVIILLFICCWWCHVWYNRRVRDVRMIERLRGSHYSQPHGDTASTPNEELVCPSTAIDTSQSRRKGWR